MKDKITYSLKSCDCTSDKYYRTVGTFTNEVLFKINQSTEGLISDFQSFILKNNYEDLRSKNEYVFELLLLGVLWRNYIKKAIILGEVPKAFLIRLMNLREKSKIFKVAVDYIKGFSGKVWLLKENNEINDCDRTIENMKKLLDWLAASGEFNQEVKRLKQWYDYLSNRSLEEVSNVISMVLDLAEWFDFHSEKALGCFTRNVNKFLEENYHKHKWKEDNVYCGRKRIEYHLNMVGAEIMNRAFREDFLKTEEKRLLLPICMRFHCNSDCKAERSTEGYLCTGCTNHCNVNYLTQMGRKYGIKVFIIPHESAAFTKGKIEKNKIGIIGVACVLNLASGGWKAKELGFVPQCVLLDYCGCKNHWSDSDEATEINISKLMDILQISEI
ncbi:DUF116 domain-containing protein [Wukongibacter sp. M2B1]|uniref:DUF116 domain-containing protein n=1 Tax=Wukongibacter sp. M2B1 TaxID=3088895 RepID=UPI003D7908FC